ncbi:MAG: DMT family transporter [Rhodobacteraceae bacterium]|jgi:drug/metabolite transporter (DMT)-like permease|nr:DMT family transporter [Paracoccaceae bacterium]
MTSNPSIAQNLTTANLICMASMFVWAAGLPAADLIIPLIPPLPLTAMRTGMAAAVLMAFWLLIEGPAPIRQANWLRGVVVGFICIGLGAVFLVIGQAYTDAVTVAIITLSMPLIGIGLEVLQDGRRVTLALIMGMALSLLGGLVAMGQGGFSIELGLGALAVMASCAAFTWGSRATVKQFPALTPLGRTAITVTGAFIATSALSVTWTAMGGAAVQWAALGWKELGALTLFAVGSMALSQILWIISVERIGIGAASLHMNAVPFYVMIIAFALGAPWNWLQTLGALIVVVGVMIGQGMLRIPR